MPPRKGERQTEEIVDERHTWRLRTEETPCMYETEYLSKADMWANDVNITMYKEFRRTFRIPFGLCHDMGGSLLRLGQISRR
jgi:hypothetical protein